MREKERERETGHEWGWGREREGETETEAGSRLRAVRTEPDAGLEPTDREIMGSNVGTWGSIPRTVRS